MSSCWSEPHIKLMAEKIGKSNIYKRFFNYSFKAKGNHSKKYSSDKGKNVCYPGLLIRQKIELNKGPYIKNVTKSF